MNSMREIMLHRVSERYLFAKVFADRFNGSSPVATDLLVMIEDLVNSQIDGLSGLLTRRAWFEILREEICKALFLPEEQHILSKETLERAKKAKIAVVYVDAAFLGLLNSFSHRIGDKLIKGIGEATRNIARKECYIGRLGGDEFAVIVIGLSIAELQQCVSGWEQSVEDIHIEELAGSGLTAHIDAGAGYLTSAVEFALSGFSPAPEDVLRSIEENLVGIADIRSAYVKCAIRLKMLANLWVRDRDKYNKWFYHLSKGANNPSKREIRRLARLTPEGRYSGLFGFAYRLLDKVRKTCNADLRVKLDMEVATMALRGTEEDSLKAFALKPYRDQLENRKK